MVTLHMLAFVLGSNRIVETTGRVVLVQMVWSVEYSGQDVKT
jgi:hypothetical protein